MNRIKELRTENETKQKDLAKALNLTQQTISLYESNSREPDIKTIKLIANYFNVSIDYLLKETNVRNRYDEKETNIINKHNEKEKLLILFEKELIKIGYDLSETSLESKIEIIISLLNITKKLEIIIGNNLE